MLISIVIPTYHSARFIDKTVQAVEDFSTSFEHDIELVVIDDGSIDATYETLCGLADQITTPMTILQLFTNRGQFHALMAGLAAVRGEYIVTLDDDLEYNPAEIPTLLDAFQQNPGKYDVVIGKTAVRQTNPIRKFGTWLNNEFNSIMFRKPKQLRSGSFRMLTGQYAAKLVEYRTANPIVGPLIYRSSRRIVNVEIKHSKGVRVSNYSFFRLIDTFIRNFQNFSEFPLRYISIAGLSIAAISILYALFVVVQYFTGFPWPIKAPGWASLIVSISFFSGMILASIGLLGQYTFRIIEEVSKNPNYQIRAKYETERGDSKTDVLERRGEPLKVD